MPRTPPASPDRRGESHRTRLHKKVHVPREHNLAFVAGFVLSTAAGKKGIIETSGSSTQLLEIAAETVNQWLSEGKGQTITDAEYEDIE